jgi:hypothetical protein
MNSGNGRKCQNYFVNVNDDPRSGEREEVIVPLETLVMISEPDVPEVILLQLVSLDHSSHGPVDDEDPRLEVSHQLLLRLRHLHGSWGVLK